MLPFSTWDDCTRPPLPPDPYLILGLRKDADTLEIITAYSELIQLNRPDRFQDPARREQQQVVFQRIIDAYALLTDETALMNYYQQRWEQYDIFDVSNLEATLEVLRHRETPSPRIQQLLDELSIARTRTDSNDERENLIDSFGEPFDYLKKEEKSGSISLQAEKQSLTETLMDGVHISTPLEEEIKKRNSEFQQQRKRSQPPRSPKDTADGVPGADTDSETVESSKKKLYFIPDEQRNLKVMNPSLADAQVDIIAVHGLGAIPDITWTCRRKDSEEKINWLSDEEMLPKATPKARILRFGYDSLWMGSGENSNSKSPDPIRTSLSKIAIKLLLCLGITRITDMERPLIFIGHCFGGLVIERALNLARMFRTKYPGIFDSSVGVVFLGTPHRGSDSFTRESALLKHIAASSDMSKHLDTNILEAMTSTYGDLLDVADDFINFCAEGGPRIACFYEQRSSRIGKIIGKNEITEFMVGSKSATFDGHPKYGLEEDHFSLNKFDSPTNSSYIQVRAAIQLFYHEALRRIPKSKTPLSLPRLMRPRKQDADDDETLRKEAIEELGQEDDRRQSVLRKEESLKEKQVAEQFLLQCLKRNMAKYGVKDPEAILSEHPLPKDENLSPQEIQDKERWYKNHLKTVLSDEGLDGGQIDEIMNNMGHSATIDGVDTVVTRMAAKWVSTRTLNRYDIPWEYDKNDPSTIIVQRWVPHYEQEFIWDHSFALRDGKTTRPREKADRTQKEREATEKAERVRNWSFRRTGDKSGPPPTVTHYRKSDAQQAPKFKDSRRRSRISDGWGTADDDDGDEYRARRHRVAESSRQRGISSDSIRSAPDSDTVGRRRRNSRTLSSRHSSPTPQRESIELTRNQSWSGFKR